MANITIKNPAEYDNKVRKLETTDKAHADIFNGIFEKLVNNQEFLKLITDEAIKHMETSEIHVTTENKRHWDDKAETSTATQSENGLMSNIDKTKLDHIADKAEVNQNAISSISAGGSVIEANSKTAQIAILSGSDNVTVTGDNATKQVKIAVSGGNADTLGGRVASDLSVNYANSAGNADTVNNLHAVDFVQNKHLSLPASELNNPNYTLPYIGEIRDGAEIGLPSGWWHICYFSHANHDGHGAQLAVGITNANKMYMRTSLSNTWQAWQEVITSANINAQNVNYASAANYANSANNANYASNCDNAAKLEGRTAAQVLLLGGKHLAGQGAGGGYSFAGDGAEDTGMFSDADGDLYLMRNGRRIDLPGSGTIPNTAGTIARATNAENADTVDGKHAHEFSTATQVRRGNGTASTIEGGSSNTADGYCAHAEGDQAAAGGYCAHVEGCKTSAAASYSHAEGYMTIANGTASHTSGQGTLASGRLAAAFGRETRATGWCSFAIGKFNIDPATADNIFNSPFMIGNGSDDANRANIFRIQGTGDVYAKGYYSTGGADYAEFWEWLDSNSSNEDRTGYFVTLDKDKIKIANSEDDYILGIISAAPSVIGNSYEDQWANMYLKDEWGRVIYEEVEIEEEKDEEGNVIVEARKEMQPKINSAYDNSKKYVGRSQRKEWSAVGMLGQLLVRDDGTCKENGYCKCGNGGIATAAETGYRVLARVSDNIIKILFK